MNNITKKADAAGIEESIESLNKYVNDVTIEPVILALEAIKNDIDNDSLIAQLTEALDSIGVMQGAVLTYAPYVSFLISNGLFEDD